MPVQLTFLSKSLLPPPEKWHGLTDVEQRYRKRYVDLFSNPESLQTFLGRSKIIAAFRDIMAEKGFVEVETPTMQSIAGGAAARPFVTHHNTLDIDLFLRIAPELYLKRLLVGGMERVFEIGRVYRNEGISPQHNPEFTMMEAYQAYGDYHTMMDLTEALIVGAIDAIGGDYRSVPGASTTIDFTPPWPRRTYAELLAEHAGVDPADDAAVQARAGGRGSPPRARTRTSWSSEVFEEVVEDRLDGPMFVTDYPAAICPLTKRKAANPAVAERFELLCPRHGAGQCLHRAERPALAGSALPQPARRPAGRGLDGQDGRRLRPALKHAMPPAGGLGIGIDRLCMLCMNRPSIRDVILFPLLRPNRRVTPTGRAMPWPSRLPVERTRPMAPDAEHIHGRSGRRVQVLALLAVSRGPGTSRWRAS